MQCVVRGRAGAGAPCAAPASAGWAWCPSPQITASDGAAGRALACETSGATIANQIASMPSQAVSLRNRLGMARDGVKGM